MTFEDLWPVNLRTAFIVIGFICLFLGLLLRGRSISSRGLAVALLVVGFMMFLMAPAGRFFGWW